MHDDPTEMGYDELSLFN